MIKSENSNGEDFIKKGYAKIPQKIEERLRPRDFTVSDEAQLRYDGKQFAVRIPVRISRFLKLDEEKTYFLRFKVIRPPPDKEGKPSISIEFFEKESP